MVWINYGEGCTFSNQKYSANRHLCQRRAAYSTTKRPHQMALFEQGRTLSGDR